MSNNPAGEGAEGLSHAVSTPSNPKDSLAIARSLNRNDFTLAR